MSVSVLIPLNKSKTRFDGFLKLNHSLHRISIEKFSTSFRFVCDWKLHQHLKLHSSLLKKRLEECLNIPQFLGEVKLLLDANTLNFGKDNLNWNAKFYDIVLQHLQDVGWENIANISDDFLIITMQACDLAERKHTFCVNLSYDYPSECPEVTTTLPMSFDPLWTSDSDLVTLHNQFKSHLRQFERLWEDVEELKQNTWILEPESPNFAATSFRIALSKTSSIQIKIDPLNVDVAPEYHFLGAEWSIANLQEKFQQKYEEWNESLSLYQNLKNILEIDFPEKQCENSQDVSLRCGICYAFRHGMSVPDQICNDKRCGQPFHHECLLEWIRSRPEAKQSFNVVFGECPYCTQPIKLYLLQT